MEGCGPCFETLPPHRSFKFLYVRSDDCPFGLVVRISGYYPRGPGFDSRHYKFFCIAVGLERDPLSLVSLNEELLEQEIAALV
jgi:hypothetical protein